MGRKIEIISDVKDGHLQKSAREQISAALPGFNDKRVIITIDVVKNTRSDRQNRYYWGVVVNSQIDCFKERWGEIYTPTQLHDWNKSNVWHAEKVDEATGEVFKIPGTSRVSVGDFEERLEILRQFFFNRFEWIIPLPNEQL